MHELKGDFAQGNSQRFTILDGQTSHGFSACFMGESTSLTGLDA
jgi:hypothetical protein